MSVLMTDVADRSWASERSNLEIANIFWLVDLAHVRTALAISSRPQATADLVRRAAPATRIDTSEGPCAEDFDTQYDLIVVLDHAIKPTVMDHTSSSNCNVGAVARMALKCLAPNGILVIIESNPAWYRHVLAMLPRLPAPFADASPCLMSRRLARAGYSSVQVFLIDPKATHPKAIVPAQSGMVAAHLKSERDRASGQALHAKLAVALLGGAGLLYPARAIIAKK